MSEEQAKGKYDIDYKKPPPTQYPDEVERKWEKSASWERNFRAKAPEINTAGTDVYSEGE